MAFQQQGQAFVGQFGFSDPASEWAARAAFWAQQQRTGLPTNQPSAQNVLQATSIRPLMALTPAGYAPAPNHPGHPYPVRADLSMETMPFQRVDDFHEQHVLPMKPLTAPGQFVGQPTDMQLESVAVPLHPHPALIGGQFEVPSRFVGPPGEHREPWNVQAGVSSLTSTLQQHLPVAPMIASLQQHLPVAPMVASLQQHLPVAPMVASLQQHLSVAPMVASKPVPLFQVGTALGSEPAKKRLPAWIRDGLAKAGRDLQKKMHVEMEEQQLALSQKQNDRQEQSAIEVGNDEIPAGLRRISGYDQSVSRTPSPPTDEEEEDVEEQKAEDSDGDTEAEPVNRVRQLLTEILLGVTNEEVMSVAEEVVSELQSRVLKTVTTAAVLGGTALSVSRLSASYESDSDSGMDTKKRSMSSSAMAGLTNYGSSSENEEEVAVADSPQRQSMVSHTEHDEKSPYHEELNEKVNSPRKPQSPEKTPEKHRHTSSNMKSKSRSPPPKQRRSRSRSRSPTRHRKKRSRSRSRRRSRSQTPRRRHSRAHSPSRRRHKHKSRSRSKSPGRSRGRKRSRRS